MTGLVRNTRKAWFAGWHTPTRLSGNPNGYLAPASFMLPIVAGGVSSYKNISGTGSVTGNAAAGLNASASCTGSGDISSAVAQLVVSAIAALSGSGSLTADLTGQLQAAAALAGSGTVAAVVQALASLQAGLSGTGTITATGRGVGSVAADIRGYSDLTPEGLRDAVWAAAMESGITAQGVMQLIAAFTAGKTDITDLGGGNATVVFRDLADTKNRIEGTMAGSERTAVVRDTD